VRIYRRDDEQSTRGQPPGCFATTKAGYPLARGRPSSLVSPEAPVAWRRGWSSVFINGSRPQNHDSCMMTPLATFARANYVDQDKY
jgi:hypothetical protein